MPNEILLVEDDRDIVNIIKRYLDSDEFTLTWCPGVKSIDELGDKRFDVALLDIMLGNASGLDVCARLRARYDCPIIFVSAIDDSETIIRALEMGGDDYVTKPFDAQVLVARIKANLRSFMGHTNTRAFPSTPINASSPGRTEANQASLL